MPWTVYNSDGKVLQSAEVGNNSVTNAKMADDAVDSAEIVAGAIDLAHMSANSIDSAQYVDGSIDLAHMSVNSIDSDQYVDGSIDLAHMSVNSIDSDQYVDGSIDLVHMSADSVDSAQYVDGSIDTAHIAGSQITNALMADNAIDSAELAAGSVDIAHLSASGSASSSTFLAGNNAWAAAGGGTSPTQVMVYETSSAPQQRTGVGYAAKVSTEGNFTTNNTSTHQQIITLDITIGATGDRSAIQYGFIATARNGNTGYSIHLQPQIDAVGITGSNGLAFDQAVGGYNMNASFTGVTDIIDPRANASGTNTSHAVRMTVKVSNGTVTVYRSDATHCTLWAIEIRAHRGGVTSI